MDEKKTQAPPMNGERAFEDTDGRKHKKIIDYVSQVKDRYFGSPEYKAYIEHVQKLKWLIRMEWPTDEKTTRFGIMSGLMRAARDKMLDACTDLFDVDDMAMVKAEYKRYQDKAEELSLFMNRILRSKSVRYNQYLNRRFQWLPDYGWSIGLDTYQINEGWGTKAQAAPFITGLEKLTFTREMDTLLDGPKPLIVKPEEWFGSIRHSTDQPFQGTLKRWYLKDVVRAMAMETADGKPVYNVKALAKLKDMMLKGQQESDAQMSAAMEADKTIQREIQRKDGEPGAYIDVICYQGPLSDIQDADFAGDANEYYVECTANLLLRWQESAADGSNMLTHLRTHPDRSSPFSASALDTTRQNEKFQDFILNAALENVVDNLTRMWAVWEEDLLDPNDFYFPKGFNSFLVMKGGKTPQLIGDQRSGAFSDFKDLMLLFDRNQQRTGISDQEMGAMGQAQDKTATAARILASATNRRDRAMVKRIAPDIVQQMKNLTMLALVHGNPKNLSFFAPDGKQVKIGPEHVELFLTGSMVDIHDTITRDRNDEAMKAQQFFQYAAQILPALNTPDHAIAMLRYAGDLSGIPQTVIDTVVPKPNPAEVAPPPMPGMGGPQPAPGTTGQAPALPPEAMEMMQGEANAANAQ